MAGFYAARSWIIPPLPWLDLQAPLPPAEVAHFTASLLDGGNRFQTGQFFSLSGGWSD